MRSWTAPSVRLDLNSPSSARPSSPAPKLLRGASRTRTYTTTRPWPSTPTPARSAGYYQHLHDDWDLDHPFKRLLVDTAVAPDPDAVAWVSLRPQPGAARRVITGIPGKTGVVDILDRETGEFLWPNPTVAQNVIAHTCPGPLLSRCPRWQRRGARSPRAPRRCSWSDG